MTRFFAAPARSRLSLLLLTLICIAYSVWVLSLPLFPTQDGPVHLYLAHVLGSVLAHPDGFYGRFYFVRHLLPPYALYYYLLIGLSSFLPVLLADKLVVCLYFFLFAFGFRFLARAIGPGGDWTALAATLLLLNWPLGMGFTNFCLATALALWTLGIWCRAPSGTGRGRRSGFIALCFVILLTHPVPLLGVLGFAGLDLLLRLLRERRVRPLVADAITLVAASGTLLYLRLFTTGDVVRQVHVSAGPYWRTELTLLKGYLLLHSLTAFAGRSLADIVYRLLFYGLIAGSFALALGQFRRACRAGIWTPAETWTVASVLFLLVFPFIPSDLNHSAYFSARLLLLLWTVALAAASGASFSGRALRLGVVGVSVLAAGFTLTLAESRLRPIAQDLATAERTPAIATHSLALLLHEESYQPPASITYDPYFWTGTRMARRTESVLWNTPWLDLPIIPLGPGPELSSASLSPAVLESPPELRRWMASSGAARSAIPPRVDVVLFSSGAGAADRGRTEAAGAERDSRWLNAGLALPEWSCRAVPGSMLCSRR